MKNHFRNLKAPLCGMACPHKVDKKRESLLGSSLFLCPVLSENSGQSRKKRKRIGKILLKLPKIIAVLGRLWYIVTIHTFMWRYMGT